MPVALTVGGQDTIVPPGSVRRLARKISDLHHKYVLMIDDEAGGHATGYDETVTALEFVIRSAESIAASR
jgi:predicted esterase